MPGQTSTPRSSIVYLTDTLNPGGAERQLTELVLRLDRSQFAPHVFVYTCGNFFQERLEAGNVPVHQVIRRSKFDLRPVKTLANWLRKREVDLIHAFSDTPNAYAVLAKKIAGRGKIIASVRSAADKGRSDLDWLVKSWAHHNADLTISNNEAGLKRVASRAGLELDQIIYLPNGIDMDRFRPATKLERAIARQELNIPSHDIVFLSIGTIYWRKNYAGYERAMQSLDIPHHWKFVWVGRTFDEELLASLRWHIEAQNLEQNFMIFSEPTSDVLSLYHAADILVLNSLSEGTPNVVIEAMACGLPVISTDVGDAAKLVIQAKTGWLIPPENDVELAHAILAAAQTSPDQREEMGRAGRQHLLTLGLDIETVVKSHERIYKDVLAGKVIQGEF